MNANEVVASTQVGVCNQQPALTALPSMPIDDKADGDVDTIDGQKNEFETPYQRPHSLKSLDLGASSLMPRHNNVDLDSEPKHVQPPSLSTPRQGLVPLRLRPVVLRESPDIEFLAKDTPSSDTENRVGQRARSDSTQDLLGDSKRESYRDTRETPYQRCSRRSRDMLAMLPSTRPSESTPTRPTVSTQSSASSLRRQAIETRVLSSRPSAESFRPPARLKRKHSDPLSRKVADIDVDQEILELNTIVEERRADAARSHAPDAHIPAVAPLMKVRARSETLNDIGSAFSRPLTARDVTKAEDVLEREPRPRRPATSRGPSGSSNRVSGWLSSIITSSSPAQAPHAQESFYKCSPMASQPRPVSRSSLCSLVTELESPSLTLASSPTATSKGHSRSLTMESRLTALEPVERAYDAVDVVEEKVVGGAWRVSSPSQVGVAL